jgi:RNA 3'-terminal phosphate cyclase-like protein
VSLMAETTTGVLLCRDFKFDERFKLPEDLGERSALALLDEIFTGGVVDSSNQGLVLLLAALSSGDNISQIKLGRITQQTIQMLRHI